MKTISKFELVDRHPGCDSIQNIKQFNVAQLMPIEIKWCTDGMWHSRANDKGIGSIGSGLVFCAHAIGPEQIALGSGKSIKAQRARPDPGLRPWRSRFAWKARRPLAGRSVVVLDVGGGITPALGSSAGQKARPDPSVRLWTAFHFILSLKSKRFLSKIPCPPAPHTRRKMKRH